MPVWEVVLHRDIRAPDFLSTDRFVTRYLLRRTLSVGALLAIDVASLFVATLFWQLMLPPGEQPHPVLYRLVPLAPMTLAVFALYGLYGTRARRHNWAHIVAAGVFVLVTAAVIRMLLGSGPRVGFVLVWASALLLLLVGRYTYDHLLKRRYDAQVDMQRIIMLGGPEACATLATSLRALRDVSTTRLIGVVGDEIHPRDWQDATGLRSLGLLSELERIVERERPDQLVVADDKIEQRHLVELIELCRRQDLNLKLANSDMRFGPGSVCLVPGLDEPIFVVRQSLTGALPWLAKRAVDRVAAALLLAVLSPGLLVVAILIKATSPGPVLFTDTRVGLGQRTFRCYKFRTMYRDAAARQAELEARNEADGAIFKIRDDPRVTRVGSFLRRTSIDELPQLINVVRGEMSLVGPRPLPLRDNELLEGWHKRRHVVLPGITGLWQVNGRSDTSFEEMVDLDFRYIESWSPWLDLSIIFKTFAAVFTSRGAY